MKFEKIQIEVINMPHYNISFSINNLEVVLAT